MASRDLGTLKKNLRRGATLLFLDESGYALIPFVKRTWARAGTIPILHHSFGRWNKLSVISAVALRRRRGRLDTDVYFQTLPDKAFKATDVAAFLRRLAQHTRGETWIVWDNGGPHRGPPIRRFFHQRPRLHLQPLPPYCPELNPDEGVWNWSKTKALANATPRDSTDLLTQVRRSLRQVQRRPDVQRWCLAKTELTWDGLLNQSGRL